MTQVHNLNNDKILRYDCRDFALNPMECMSDDSGTSILEQPLDSEQYLKYIIKYWEGSNAIKLYRIEKNDLLALFHKDRGPKNSSRKRRILVVAENVQDANQVQIRWEHFGTVRKIKRETINTANSSVKKILFTLRLKDFYPGNSQCGSGVFFATIGIKDQRHYLFIFNSTNHIHETHTVLEHVSQSTFISLIGNLFNALFHAVIYPSTQSSNRASTNIITQLPGCEPHTHFTGVRVP